MLGTSAAPDVNQAARTCRDRPRRRLRCAHSSAGDRSAGSPELASAARSKIATRFCCKRLRSSPSSKLRSGSPIGGRCLRCALALAESWLRPRQLAGCRRPDGDLVETVGLALQLGRSLHHHVVLLREVLGDMPLAHSCLRTSAPALQRWPIVRIAPMPQPGGCRSLRRQQPVVPGQAGERQVQHNLCCALRPA